MKGCKICIINYEPFKIKIIKKKLFKKIKNKKIFRIFQKFKD
jgi:hypothetical protein